MATEQALLVIADIGGYTRFMQITRTNLAHSQAVVADLLEAIIDAASPPLELAKLEGDAAFFYLPLKKGMPPPAEVEALFARMRAAFRNTLTQKMIDNVCTCEGCMRAEDLTLKFVAHAGEVAFQKVKRYTELAGVDVILVHRMLKNEVPIREYVLVTEPLVPGVPPSLKSALNELLHDFEGLGEVKTFWGDLKQLPEPAAITARRHNWFVRWFDHLLFMWRAMPYQLGLKKPAADFRNFDPAIGGLEQKRLVE